MEVSWFFKPLIDATAAMKTPSAGQPDWIMKKTDSGGNGVISALTNLLPVNGRVGDGGPVGVLSTRRRWRVAAERGGLRRDLPPR